MTIEDIKQLISKDEHRQLELKKTTGELKDGMHTACAFLNTDGGWLIIGIAPNSLKILGQEVTSLKTGGQMPDVSLMLANVRMWKSPYGVHRVDS